MVCSLKDRLWWYQQFSNIYTKSISKPVKLNPMQSSICFGQGWKLTSQTTQGGVRCASRGAGQPDSHCRCMRFPMGHGKSLAWTSLTSKASVTFLSEIISGSFLSCCKTSWGSLSDRLIDLFANKGYFRQWLAIQQPRICRLPLQPRCQTYYIITTLSPE